MNFEVEFIVIVTPLSCDLRSVPEIFVSEETHAFPSKVTQSVVVEVVDGQAEVRSTECLMWRQGQTPDPEKRGLLRDSSSLTGVVYV